ncbi:hypothetical protein KDL44_07190 [bacterium]|nr:hypothetical protein [bacterium]
MARILILTLFLLAASPLHALATDNAAQQTAVIHAARSFAPWKLEAYRRRDLAWQLSLSNSQFADSILGNRRAGISQSRREQNPSGIWRSCPEGFRSGALQLELELGSAPAGVLELSLYNHDNGLITSLELNGLQAGLNSLSLDLDPALADANPTSLILHLQDGELLQLQGLTLSGDCQRFGHHHFAHFSLDGYRLSAGQSLLLR